MSIDRRNEFTKARINEMIIIGLASQKGGVGKSSLSRALATHYAGKGLTVKIADLDVNQSTSYQWQQRRLQAGIEPVISVECFGSVAQAMKQGNQYDVMIFDGAPQANKTTWQVAEIGDLIIIPTGLSVDDLQPSVILANSLNAAKIPVSKIAFALCRTGDSKSEYVEAQEYLSSTPYHLLQGHIQEKTAFRRAQDAGRSMIECQYQKPREQAKALVSVIDSRINELTKARIN